MRNELFCIRFGTTEKANEFKELFEAAEAVNAKIFEEEGGIQEKEPEDEGKDSAEKLADDLESVKVEEKKEEEAEEKKEEES